MRKLFRTPHITAITPRAPPRDERSGDSAMAKRKQLFHPDDVKRKIQASQLINRLQTHALSDFSDESCDVKPMLDSQVRAAFGLLDKVVPSLKAVEHSGTGENGEIIFQTLYEAPPK